jgi:hypothetical protein
MEPAKPDFALTADALAKEFLADPKAAQTKYNGKSVEVTGEVNFIEQRNAFTFHPAKKDGDNVTAWVGCYVLPEDAPKSALFTKGQKVKAIGKFKDLVGSTITLNDCRVSELEPNKLLVLSAEDVANAFEKDAKAAAEKFGEKQAVVTGVIEDIKAGSRPIAYFKGNGKIHVAVEMKEGEARQLKKGQEARVRGTFEGTAFKDKEAKVHSGLFVQSK